MRKIISIYLISFLSLLILSCAKQENGKTVLDFWQFWTDPQVKPTLMEIIQQFEKENPEIKINLTDLTWSEGHEKIVVAFASGTAPDILELGSDWVPEFSSQDVLLDVTSDAEKIQQDFLMWEPVFYKGRIYGFPWLLDTRVLFYNKDLMKKAGLDPEKPPLNWKELLSYCQKINQLKPKAYGFGANSAERHRLYKKFLPFFWGNGGKILSSDQKSSEINSTVGIEALSFYKKLTEQGTIDNQRMLDENFKQGKIGFVISGGWLLNDIQKNLPDLKFGVCHIPKPEKGVFSSFAGGEFLVISKKSKNPDSAKKFIQYLIKKENSLKLCKAIGSAIPSAKGSELDPYYQNNKYLLVFQEQLRYAQTSPAVPQWIYIEEIIEKAVEQVMYDKKTPSQALDETKLEIDKILK
ncbi:MAG: extracellular solute-binding protein [candidate division Zixibacteria bacterium]|nr:extracellular solute-binding protein [candidate division Zixibacteria bacterium]